MKKIRAITGLATLAAAGVLAALALAPPAAAYTPDQLPGLGYSVSVGNLSDGCHLWKAGYGDAAKTDLGNDCDSGFQARLDAFIAATCPCAQPTTTDAAPATGTDTTATVAAPSTSTPGATVSGPDATTTIVQTTTTVVTVTTADPTITDQLAAIQAKLDDLTTRVARIEAASQAADLAYQLAVADGSAAPAAADIARGTFLNAEYGLGAFA